MLELLPEPNEYLHPDLDPPVACWELARRQILMISLKVRGPNTIFQNDVGVLAMDYEPFVLGRSMTFAGRLLTVETYRELAVTCSS
jgi:hypothetical protein